MRLFKNNSKNKRTKVEIQFKHDGKHLKVFKIIGNATAVLASVHTMVILVANTAFKSKEDKIEWVRMMTDMVIDKIEEEMQNENSKTEN